MCLEKRSQRNAIACDRTNTCLRVTNRPGFAELCSASDLWPGGQGICWPGTGSRRAWSGGDRCLSDASSGLATVRRIAAPPRGCVRTEQYAEAFPFQLNGVNMKPLSLFATGTLLAASFSISAFGQATALAPPSSSEALWPFAVHAAQVRLHSLGMYTGPTSGVWDRATQIAVERFQRYQGLPPSGLLDPSTLAAMGLSPNEGGTG